MTINIIYNNLEFYCILFIISTLLLIKIKKEFSQEGLLDYIIYLNTKIVLFVTAFSCLLISIILINDPLHNVSNFFSEVSTIILIYLFFNYGIIYFMKLVIYIKQFTEKNDLMATKLIKDKIEVKLK